MATPAISRQKPRAASIDEGRAGQINSSPQILAFAKPADEFIQAPDVPPTPPLTVKRFENGLKVLFEKHREVFNAIFETGNTKVKDAKTYEEARKTSGEALGFVFEGIEKGQVQYTWLEMRHFPAFTRADDDFVAKLSGPQKEILKQVNNAFIKVGAAAELPLPPPRLEKPVVEKRLQWLKNLTLEHLGSDNVASHHEPFAAAVKKEQVLLLWEADGKWPLLYQIPKQNSDPKLFQVVQAAFSDIGQLRSILETPPKSERSAALLVILQLMSKRRAETSKAFEVPYETGLIFQNAILSGKIRFEWKPGKAFPTKGTIDPEFLKNLNSKQKDGIRKLMDGLVQP